MLPLVLLDLDGTVIGPNGDIAPQVWDALDEATSEGAVIAVCTGRALQGVAGRIARRLGADIPHIFHNGALIARADGTVLQSHRLAEVSATSLVHAARDRSITLELYTPTEIYVDRICARCERHAEVLELNVTERDLLDVIRSEDVIRAHWIMAPEELPQVLQIDASPCVFGTATSPALPESVFASVTCEGVSKGSAAHFAAQYLGVELRDVMAIGDSMGDLPMLEVVGHPRVMRNASEELIARFPSLPAVEEHGVIEALKQAKTL